MKPISRLTLRLQSDSRLVELAAGGHEPAFEAIFDRYCSPLLRYCARLLPFDRAEDVVQQTFENAFAALSKGDHPRRLRPWLYRIAHNLAVNTLQKNGWDYEQLDENYDGVPQPPDIVAQRERLAGLVNQIQGLSDRQRSALVMHVLEGHSYAAIARELDATPPVVRQLLHRARTRLRDSVGVLVPLPLIRALLASGAPAPGTEQVATAAAGAGAGAGIVKVGAGLFAAATIAGSLGIAVQHENAAEQHGSPARPNAVQSHEATVASSPPKPKRENDTRRPVSHNGVASPPHRQVVDGSNEDSSGDHRLTAERHHAQGDDEEKVAPQGRPDHDDEGTEARFTGKEDDEPGRSEGHSGGESDSPESGKSGGHEGESGDSAPSTGEAPAEP
jgi:RNA polymerase sigma factor (sigma-70 family)